MNLYALIPLFTSILSVAMASYVIAIDYRSSVNRAFVLISFIFIGWGLTDFLLWIPVDSAHLYLVARLQTPFYTLSGYIFIHFSYRFLRRPPDIIYWLIFISSALAALLGLFTPWIVQNTSPEIWGTAIVTGVLFGPLAFVTGAIPNLFAFYLLYKHKISTDDILEKKQINLYLSGAIVAVSVAYLTDFILPRLLNTAVFPHVHTGGLIFQALVFIAIVKYRFFAINIYTVADDLFSNAKEGVALISNGQVIKINQQASRMLKPLPVDKTILLFIDEFNQQRNDIKDIEKTVTDGKCVKSLSFSCSPIIMSDIKKGEILFLRDITLQKENEREIRQMNTDLAVARDQAMKANNAKSQFLANMSHEIRTPLTSIIGYTDILRSKILSAEDQSSAIDTIYDNSHHLMGIINDILDLSKIEAKKLEIEKAPVSPITIIRELERTYRSLVERKGLAFQVNIELPLPDTIDTDRTRLQQILFNLLNNAVKFTDKGCVSINCRFDADNKTVVFEVTDTGIGIKDEQMLKLFSPFTQADISTTRKYGGTGLGLSICKNIAQMLDCDFIANSKFGDGSSFSLIIKCPTNDAIKFVYELPNDVISNRRNEPTYEWSDKHILLVEDSVDIQNLLKMYLNKSAINITIANNGQEALDEAEKSSFNLILMDMQMPVMDGYTATKILRERGNSTPIIALTANALVQDHNNFKEIGITGFLPKPIIKNQFFQTLDGFLGKNIHSNDDIEISADLIEKFKGRLPDEISLMWQAVENNDMQELELIAHRLKGLGGSFGYPVITKLCLAIGISIKNNKPDELIISIKALDTYVKNNIHRHAEMI